MKALIAVELHGSWDGQTCEGCPFLTTGSGLDYCRGKNTYTPMTLRQTIKDDPRITPVASCPLRTSQADRLVREAMALLRDVSQIHFDDRLETAIDKLSEARQ